MKKKCWFFLILSSALVQSCNMVSADKPGLLISSEVYDFKNGAQGWELGFADFPAGPDDSTYYELQSGLIDSPSGGKALFLSGLNHNQDLFFFMKKKVSDLQPNAVYTLTFEILLERENTTYGTAWGQQIFLKAGASAAEPKAVIDGNNFVMNIDKGNHQEGGTDMVFMGDLSSQQIISSYVLITRTNASADLPIVGKANSKGELWLSVGADATAEGACLLNFTKISVVLTSSY